MLVLTRNAGERIFIKLPDGSKIVVQVVAVHGRGCVRVGIEAARDILILREEVKEFEK